MPNYRLGPSDTSLAYSRLEEAVLKALPPDIDDKLALEWVHNSVALSKGLRSLLIPDPQAKISLSIKPQILIPQINEVFELSLPGEIAGLELLHLFGYRSKGWKFSGRLTMTGALTRRFKLTGVDECDNLHDVCRKLVSYGDVPAGQWLEAFRQAYPQNDGNGPIGSADPSWIDPKRDSRFPVLLESGPGWKPRFVWATGSHGSHWRWIFEISGTRKVVAT